MTKQEMEPITFSPFAGKVYEGDQSKQDFTETQYNYPLRAKTIASMGLRNILEDKVFSASTRGLSDDLIKELAANVKQSMSDVTSPAYVGRHRDGLVKMAEFKNAEDNMLSAGVNNFVAMQMYQAEMQFNASVSENDQSFITLVPLMREVITNPAELYFAEGAFRSLNLPTLQGRVPERDAYKAQFQLEPGEEEDFTRVKYGDERFDLKPNVVPLMQFQESRIRATIDPLMIDMQQARTALREAREAMAIVEVQGKLNGQTAVDILDYTADGTAGFPRSENAPHTEFLNIINSHWDANRILLDTIFIHPVDFAEYLTNWYRATVTPTEIKGWGIMPFPGLPGIRAVISPFVSRGYAWACASKALLKGEGPFMEEMWREPGRRADLGHLVDYVQFLFVTPSRYGLKLDLKSVSAANKGTVYTTLDSFEDKLEKTYAGITSKVRDKVRTLS